ncbi:MAG: DUF6356 family protein [Bacteroidetes bacterium]|nr:DUF6356 family protein [Bacteroidota bacterium]
MNTTNIFTRHPKEVRMTYLEHTRFALMLSGATLSCAIASFIHAFFPFLFVTHTSSTIRQLQNIFDQREQELSSARSYHKTPASTVEEPEICVETS